jgi:hypothetical protein
VPDKTTDEEFPIAMSVDYVRVWQLPEDRITQSTTVETPSQKTPTKKIPTDWTKDKYIAKETLKWSQKGWCWNLDIVEAYFRELDTNKDGLTSGQERKAWFAKTRS